MKTEKVIQCGTTTLVMISEVIFFPYTHAWITDSHITYRIPASLAVHINIVLGLHCSVKPEDIMTHFMYRAELCFQRCAEASARV